MNKKATAAVTKRTRAAKAAKEPTPFKGSKPRATASEIADKIAASAKRKVSRSAETGKIVSAATAKANPATTVTETVDATVGVVAALTKLLRKGALKIPKSMGAVADALYIARQERLAINKLVDQMEKDEATLREHIIDNLPKSQATGVSGKVANVKVETKPVPQVQDWAKFQAHLKKTGDFDLMQRRLNDKAVKERWEAKKKVPGVVAFDVVKVSVTKV